MTTKERLHELIDALDDAADRLLAAALALAPAPAAQPPTGPADASGDAFEAFIGSVHSGRSDLSSRHRQIRAEAFGGRSARDL